MFILHRKGKKKTQNKNPKALLNFSMEKRKKKREVRPGCFVGGQLQNLICVLNIHVQFVALLAF